MGRYASEVGGTEFQPAPEGTFPARCVQLIDLGTQHGEWEGKPTVRSTVVAQFELPTEMVDTADGEKPALVALFWTNSLNEKSRMRADLEAWRGRAFTDEERRRFDLQSILGKPCLVTVQHKTSADRVRARITRISAMPKGMACPDQVNPSKAFWIDEFDESAFSALPDGFRRMIESSDEYKAMRRGDAPRSREPGEDDDIPW